MTDAVSAKRREGTIMVHGTSVSVWEDAVNEPAMFQVFRSVLARMLKRGWQLQRDPHTLKYYPSIAGRHWTGAKGDLRMHAQTVGRTMEVELFQEINVENPNGGRFDFDKFARMPRRLRSRCVVEMAAVVRRLFEHGYTPSRRLRHSLDDSNLLMSVLRLAENKPHADILEAFNRGGNFPSDWARGVHRFARDERGWPTVKEYDPHGRNRDRDGVPLRNGQTKYFRDRSSGRLLRGVIFTNMNQMWSVTTGCGRRYIHRDRLFNCDRPDLEKRRFVAGQQERLRKEMTAAVARDDYQRVIALASVLERRAKR